MSKPRNLLVVLAGLVGAIALLVLNAGSARATHVAPVLVPGNPNCTDRGYDFGFKPQPEPPPTGTYTFPGGSVTITSNGTFFDWTSTLGMDAVIVKGGNNANEYVYDESLGDTGLHPPVNASGRFAGISHIEFCYDFELTVSKTADTTYTRTYTWDIKKSVTPATWDMFTGDSGTSDYSVVVDRTGYTDSDWAVSGTITAFNNTPYTATVTSVTDSISEFGSISVSCPVSFPAALAPGASLFCTYNQGFRPD